MPTPLPISSECNRDYTAARGWSAPRDPLVLDLDGDGIETVGINPAAPVLFDHDGDTLRTGTGWVGTDDGLLVLDINSNGVIDTGRELFGDNTRLGSAANAPNAANGYQALAQHDSNSDGQINSADAVYSQLRVWRDLNQDGTSQAGELQTLAQTGIASIGVAGTPTGTNLGNGNTQIYSGSFTRTNGSTGQSGVAELSGSLLLASNNFYSQFTVNPPLTAAALALPQMRGSGWVRDMREAASLGTPAAASLEQQLAAYSAATTRGEQRALLSGLAAAWGISSGGVQQVNGRPIGLWTLNVLPAGMTTTSPSGIKTITPEGGLFLSRLSILEAFNGDNFFDITLPDVNGNVRVSSGGGGGGGVGSVAGGAIDVHLSQNQVDLINSSWTSLTNSLYSSLLLQTRLRPYLDSIALVINANGVQFDTAGLAALLASVKTTNLERALTDLVELNQYAGSTLRAVDFAGLVLLKDWIDALPANSPLRATLVELNVWGASASTGTASNDIWYGDAANNTFTAGAGDDSLVGYGGDDVLYGGDGADSLDGGVGADLLMGGAGNDVLIGGAGNDTLAGGVYDSWNGNYNGAGNDTYIFGAGDGQDNIHDNDTTANNLDQIIFRAGVLPANVTVIRSGDNLILRIDGSTDQITVSGYFGVDGTNGAQIEQIRFTDAPTTVWSVSTIKAMALIGGAGADTLVGYASADTLSGGDGNDNISGLDGNDTVNGGNGSDYLYGNNGDDTLNGDADGDLLMGGAGNDTLNGGAGNDTLAGGVYDSWNGNYQGAGNDAYLFGVGDGQDSIYDNDTTAGNLDKIVFKAGVLPANVTVVRSGDSLVLRINGTTDQITVNNYFGGDGTNGWQIEQIRFTDGTYWDYVTVQGMLASNLVGGTAAAETLTGAALDDQLLGLGGNDTLEAGAGNDWLDGGLGNDTLRGGAGSDVYLVDSAADIVIELANEGVDTVRSAVAWTLGAHVENLFLTGTAAVNGTGNTADNRLVGNSAANTLNGAEGADFMQGGLGNDTYQVDNLNDVVWEDAGEGTDTVRASLHWTLGANLENLTLLGTTAIDGTGNALNNTITGNAGANILTGGAGNDTLNAAAGNDTLAGGLGNDKLTGGAGADTYLFGRGEGIDTVVENDATAGVNDRLLFGANVTTDQLWFVQNGNNLEVSIVGSLDKVVLSNWYLGTAYHVEQFQLSDGQILTDTKVQNLVQAMAAFAPPAQGTSNWSATYQASLQPVLAANWV